MIKGPIIVIRPEPGLRKTLAFAQELGLPVEGCPLFRVVPLAWSAPAAAAFDGLLLGSGNALRHAGPFLERYRGLPVYAVGEETAATARNAGFHVVRTGQGGLQALLQGLPHPEAGTPLRLLRLAGQAHVPLDPPVGVEITTRLVYAVEALPMPDPLVARLMAGATVLLHSGEAAAHFAAQCSATDIVRERIALAALAPRVVERAGSGWRRVAVASRPDDATLLAVAAELCHEGS